MSEITFRRIFYALWGLWLWVFPLFFSLWTYDFWTRGRLIIPKETNSSGNEQDSFFSASQGPSCAVLRRLVELPNTEQICNRARIFSTQALSVQSYSLLGVACGSAIAFQIGDVSYRPWNCFISALLRSGHRAAVFCHIRVNDGKWWNQIRLNQPLHPFLQRIQINIGRCSYYSFWWRSTSSYAKCILYCHMYSVLWYVDRCRMMSQILS